MKLVGTLASYAIARAAQEEMQPRNGVAWSELEAALKDRYNSLNVSVPPNQAPAPLALLLQNGEFNGPDGKIAIEQILVSVGGLVAVANDTDAAGKVLSDLIYFLEHSFEFRFSTAKVTYNYISDLVVQFEAGIGDTLSALGKAETIVSEALRRNSSNSGPYGLKRLSFGRDVESAVGVATPLDNVDTVEFTIERRVKQPYSDNKFYSRAPFSTQEHIRVLEEMEAALKP